MVKIDKVEKIQLAADEALLVVVRGEMDESDIASIRKALVSVIPNADMSRVVVLNPPDDVELEIKTIKMEKKND